MEPDFVTDLEAWGSQIAVNGNNEVSIIIENEDRCGPYGAKCVGEPTTELCAGAIANAVYHATGKRIRELPINLERVVLGYKLTKKKRRAR